MREKDNKIAIYSRKSKFTGKGESIGNQVELCKEYIKNHYGEDMLKNVVVYEDEGFSGKTLNRPDFKKMMEDAKKNRIQTIVVYRLDRISRNVSDFAGLIEELARLEVDFISIREQFDTTSAMGRAMLYISSVFSQLERETIAERIRDNMYELAKTGRWLGGVTPTGYTSEAVKSITIDGKAKKACKLKVVPEEVDTIRMIYDLYKEFDSQTLTEAELLNRGIKTKNGKEYTRFAIKGILQNPVYMIADEDAYEYFVRLDADLYSEKEAFDGVKGIMAYNRTIQERGRATIHRPVNEWVISVGEHPGIIPGKVWVAVQESLERNKSKAFRKSRSNEALLTGLLFCSCGHRMYPKLSKRKTADGEAIFSYVCKMKERSQKKVCNNKNANGNTLDMAIIEEVKKLGEDSNQFISRLEQSRKFYMGNRNDYEEKLNTLYKEKASTEKKLEKVVDSLIEFSDGIAKTQITKRIEQLNQESLSLDKRIQELEGVTSQRTLSDIEFDIMRQLLTVFRDNIDSMTLEQKRSAVRTLVRKVVWDGTNAHVILFGVKDEDIEFPKNPDLDGNMDVENPIEKSDTLTHWGEDSK